MRYLVIAPPYSLLAEVLVAIGARPKSGSKPATKRSDSGSPARTMRATGRPPRHLGSGASRSARRRGAVNSA